MDIAPGRKILKSSFRTARRSFITQGTGALATIAIIKAPAKAAQYELKCGSNTAPEHPETVRLTQMWNAVERESGGRLRVTLYPNNQLGSEGAMFTQVRLGALHFLLSTAATISSVVPSLDIAYVGFIFKDEAEALHVMDGPLGAYLSQEMASKGLYGLRTAWNSGMFQIGSNSHPIRMPDDFHGFKVRIGESKILLSLFRALGASPSTLGTAEVYAGLQTKLVEGTSASLGTTISQRWYEVEKYFSITNHVWSGHWLITNGQIWKGLPPDLQAIVERNNSKYASLERRDSQLLNASGIDKLTRLGIVFNQVNNDRFRTGLDSYFDFWSNEFGPTAWGLLQRSVGRKLK